MSLSTSPSDGQSVTTPPSDGQAIAWADPVRAAAFQAWFSAVQAQHGLDAASLRLASADASFRRYFRVDSAQGSRIVMDAPPDRENCAAFDRVAKLMAGSGLNVPEVLAWDHADGFMLLSDLGTRTMISALEPETGSANLPLYLQAVDLLVTCNAHHNPASCRLATKPCC